MSRYRLWLLAFGMFFFLSLAFAKRFTELLPLTDLPDKWLPGRGYLGGDVDIIRVLGPVSGYLAILVLALYIDSDKVRSLYVEPARLWLECPALLYWITRLWFFAQRRALHDDPGGFCADRSRKLGRRRMDGWRRVLGGPWMIRSAKRW